MRLVEREVEVQQNIGVPVVIKKEEIHSYEVDPINDFINATVKLTAENGAVFYENYYFEGEYYREYPSEADLWLAVDRKRSQTN